jgi:hypothetical protein
MEMAHPATRGIAGTSRFKPMANPITYQHFVMCDIFVRYKAFTYLGYVCGNDGSLCEEIQNIIQPAREKEATCLSKIQSRHGTELDA